MLVFLGGKCYVPCVFPLLCLLIHCFQVEIAHSLGVVIMGTRHQLFHQSTTALLGLKTPFTRREADLRQISFD